MRKLVLCLDKSNLHALASNLALRAIIPSFRSSIATELDQRNKAVAEPGSAAQHADVFELLKHGGSSPSQARDGRSGSEEAMGMDFSLPFNPISDSRKNFPGRGPSSAYGNREETRDAFVSMLEIYTRRQEGFGRGVEVEEMYEKLQADVRSCISGLMRCNFSWFADFFLLHLLNIGTRRNSDMQSLNEDEKHKLELLEQRRMGTTKAKSSGTGGAVRRKSKAARGTLSPAYQQQQRLERVRQSALFSGTQKFFHQFLEICDSHRLLANILSKACALLRRLCSEAMTEDLNEASFYRRVLRLNVLGKFIGYLNFSSNWHTGLEVEYTSSSVGFALELEASVREADLLGPSIARLDVVSLLADAWKSGSLILVVPFCVEYMRMVVFDAVSQQTVYFKTAFALLKAVERHGTIISSSKAGGAL